MCAFVPETLRFAGTQVNREAWQSKKNCECRNIRTYLYPEDKLNLDVTELVLERHTGTNDVVTPGNLLYYLEICDVL